jgi:radical SAM superfamily enzyme YgiQ (UPF0313 family)
MGVETASDVKRQSVLNKKVTTQQIKDAAGLIKKYGIYLYTYNIMGLPGETIDEAIETYKLNKEIGTDFIWCSLLQAYPGTDMSRYVKEHGFLEDEKSAFDEWFFMSSKIKLENKNEIINLQKMMQFFLKMRVPVVLIRKIIKLPLGPLFTLIFKLEFDYHKMKAHNVGLIPTIKLALCSLSFMRK